MKISFNNCRHPQFKKNSLALLTLRRCTSSVVLQNFINTPLILNHWGGLSKTCRPSNISFSCSFSYKSRNWVLFPASVPSTWRRSLSSSQTFSIWLPAPSNTSRPPHQGDQSNLRHRRTQEKRSQIQLAGTELRPVAHRSQSQHGADGRHRSFMKAK